MLNLYMLNLLGFSFVFLSSMNIVRFENQLVLK